MCVILSPPRPRQSPHSPAFYPLLPPPQPHPPPGDEDGGDDTESSCSSWLRTLGSLESCLLCGIQCPPSRRCYQWSVVTLSLLPFPITHSSPPPIVSPLSLSPPPQVHPNEVHETASYPQFSVLGSSHWGCTKL